MKVKITLTQEQLCSILKKHFGGNYSLHCDDIKCKIRDTKSNKVNVEEIIVSFNGRG